jgi:hypothetical protein
MAETPVKAWVGRPKKMQVLGGAAVEVLQKGIGSSVWQHEGSTRRMATVQMHAVLDS